MQTLGQLNSLFHEFLVSVKQNGIRKLILVGMFLPPLTTLGMADKMTSADLSRSFDALCYAAFAANVGEHFFGNKKKDATEHNSQDGKA